MQANYPNNMPNFASPKYDPYEEFKKNFAGMNPNQFNPAVTGMVGNSAQGYTAGPNQPTSSTPTTSYGGGQNQPAPVPSYGGTNNQPPANYGIPGGGGMMPPNYGQQLPGPYDRDSYYGGSMRPVNQGQIGPRNNVPSGPVNMPPPPGFEGFMNPVYDPNRPNLVNMPGGPWNVQRQFWNQGGGY